MYWEDENKTEDVDLLRASDIKASMGHQNRQPSESVKEKQKRREELEKKYGKHTEFMDARFQTEIATSKPHRPALMEVEPASDIVHLNVISDTHPALPEPYQNEQSPGFRMKEPVSNPERDAKEQQKIAARKAHEYEIQAQKDAMEAYETRKYGGQTSENRPIGPLIQGEGDMASNVHHFAERSRWYKQRAPHAVEGSQQKILQAVRDRELVREIREIYEDAYGTIDTKHQQPEARLQESSASPKRQPDVDPYRSELIAVVQRLFSELRETQALAQDERLSRYSSFRLQDLLSRTLGHMKAHRRMTECGLDTKERIARLRDGTGRPLEHVRYLEDLERAFERSVKGLEMHREHINVMYRYKTPDKSSEGLGAEALGNGKKTWTTSSSQPGVSTTASISEPGRAIGNSSGVYRVLAYDPVTHKVTSAKTTSSVDSAAERPLPLVDALNKLESPAKFLPHFASLQNGGYDVISGSRNVLVFKKVRPGKDYTPVTDEGSPAFEERIRLPNPIDGTTVQTGNFASPTGFVNHDPVLPPPPHEEQQNKEPEGESQANPSRKMRREEDVFSGTGRSWHTNSFWKKRTERKDSHRRAARRRRSLKRMLSVGMWTAACCYGVGVAAEHFQS